MRPDDAPPCRLERALRCACSNVHNVTAAKGAAGAEDRFPTVAPGERLVVTELDGPALITRMWFTFDWPGVEPYPESALRNRLVSLRIFWDDEATAAVDVPAGDFFCHPLGYAVPFENRWFASPTGRSLLSFIPMPFRRRARIEIVNEFERPVHVFHDIRLLEGCTPDDDDGWFHACFTRTIPQEPGETHRILPWVHGRGRYLGTHLSLITDRLNPLPWHDAHVKLYVDGDDAFPSMTGASLDDYCGASWDARQRYIHRDSGLLLSRSFEDGGGHFGLYHYHSRAPVWFQEDCAVTFRPKITLPSDRLATALSEHPDLASRLGLSRESVDDILSRSPDMEQEWIECGRLDDVSSTALYYLDRPGGNHVPTPKAEREAAAWQWPPDDAFGGD